MVAIVAPHPRRSPAADSEPGHGPGMMQKLLFISGLLSTAAGHGAVTHPRPRNAIDSDTHPWNGHVPWPIPFDKPNWCAFASAEAARNNTRNLTGANGQACFW